MTQTEEPTTYRVRPYARLLTMLGEQLIKNDRIALVELIKNAYDADATEVTLHFEGFGDDLSVTPESKIVIVDNGDGMNFETVRDHWLNPATDIKLEQKLKGKARTPGGRVIQGEKGIGRFAMFKLGSSVELVTRARGVTEEVVAALDIGFLDPTASESNGDEIGDVNPSSEGESDLEAGGKYDGESDAPEDPRFLDEIEASLDVREPGTAADSVGSHGTRLTIAGLRGSWSYALLDALNDDIVRLRPLRGLLTGDAGEDPHAFDVSYLIDGVAAEGLDDPQARLDSLVSQAVLRVIGSFSEERNEFDLLVNDVQQHVVADSDDMRALDMYRRVVSKERRRHRFTCGDFEFEFLVFDLRTNIEDARYHLDAADKALVRDHRIYLYRDEIRVLPYGDRDDDWLQLDVIRGTVGANRLLSNDQVLGFIYISQAENPLLRDKTNREGLIDSGAAYGDFIALLQLLINYLRRTDYQRYLAESTQRREANERRGIAQIDSRIQEIKAIIDKVPGAKRVFDDFAAAYATERKVMAERISRTEDLAGVGLSVETASHDVVASASQAHRDIAILVEQLSYELGKDSQITQRAGAIANSMSFIVSRLKDVQGLFVSAKTRPRELNAIQYARKIQSIYGRTLSELGIEVKYAGDQAVSVLTHEATLLQVFLNLMDNAIFWLRNSETKDPRITITADVANRSITFTDNGPGIKVLDIPYVFDPFFSGKGEEGRGLGLYISRQVSSRDRLNLELLQSPISELTETVPATFRLSFGEKSS